MKTLTHPLMILREQLLERFGEVEDPRVQGRCQHKLLDIIVLSFCALLSGSRSYIDIQWFGATRQLWLKNFIDLENGIPSHDTIRRVFGLMNSSALEQIIKEWAVELRQRMGGPFKRLIADGKSLKGNDKSFNKKHRPLHLVNIYSESEGIVAAQDEATGTGAGEIKAALECFKAFDLKGALVSADAALAFEVFTDGVIAQGADYLVPIKKNQKFLYAIFAAADSFEKLRHASALTEEKSHGRYERRECFVVEDEGLMDLARSSRPEIKTIFQITRLRKQKDKRFMVMAEDSTIKGYKRWVPNKARLKIKTENVFYISSRKLTPAQCLEQVRVHWEIENKLHWSLDVTFGEDLSTVRDRVAARNLSLLRKMAFNAQSITPPPDPPGLEGQKVSRQFKLKMAALDENYLMKLLSNAANPNFGA